MIPYYFALLLADDDLGLVFEGEEVSPVTLIGQWSRIIDCRSADKRIDCQSANKRLDVWAR